MTVNKRSKNSRQKGSHTHGWGAMKKHRGAGNRGGSGASGSGKRADSTKPSNWGNLKYFGKHGFVNKRKVIMRTTNISSIEERLAQLIAKNVAKPQAGGGGYALDLKEIGFDKLLSKGKVSSKLFVTCKAASAKAIEAVEAAGGKVILPKKEEVSNGSKGSTAQSS